MKGRLFVTNALQTKTEWMLAFESPSHKQQIWAVKSLNNAANRLPLVCCILSKPAHWWISCPNKVEICKCIWQSCPSITRYRTLGIQSHIPTRQSLAHLFYWHSHILSEVCPTRSTYRWLIPRHVHNNVLARVARIVAYVRLYALSRAFA